MVVFEKLCGVEAAVVISGFLYAGLRARNIGTVKIAISLTKEDAMYIRTKTSLIQTSVMAASLFIILLIIYSSASGLIYEKGDAIYNEKLHRVVSVIESKYDSLVKAGTENVEGYVKEAQKTLVEDLRANYYKDKSKDVNMFIMDSDGGIVLHPTLQAGAHDMDSIAKTMLSGQARGSLTFQMNGEQRRMQYEYFKPWKWYIGYVVEDSPKYAVIMSFLKVLVDGALVE